MLLIVVDPIHTMDRSGGPIPANYYDFGVIITIFRYWFRITNLCHKITIFRFFEY